MVRRKRKSHKSLQDSIWHLRSRKDIENNAQVLLDAITEGYTGDELEAVLIILLSAVGRRLHEVQEGDHARDTDGG